MEYLVTFSSTHAALAAEAACGGAGALVPVPPSVRAGCGMGLLLRVADDAAACAQVQRFGRSAGEQGIDGLYAHEADGSYRRLEGCAP